MIGRIEDWPPLYTYYALFISNNKLYLRDPYRKSYLYYRYGSYVFHTYHILFAITKKFVCVTVIDEVSDDKEKNFKTYCTQMANKTKLAFTWKNLTKRLPIIKWLPRYDSEDFIGDLLVGITVGLTLVPQSMAYATLAGLPPQVKHK